MASTSNLCSNIPNFNGKQFTWTGKRGASEVSELNGSNNTFPWGRVYRDAADVGFYITSSKTGKQMLFTWTETDVDRTVGELYGWRFTSVEDPEIQVYIHND